MRQLLLLGLLVIVCGIGWDFILKQNPGLTFDQVSGTGLLIETIFIVFLLVIVLWKSRQAALGQHEVLSYQASLEKLKNKMSQQEHFLRILTDDTGEGIVIFDHQNRYWFINDQAAARIGRDREDIIGATPVKTLGRVQALQVGTRLNMVRSSQEVIDALETTEAAGIKSHIQAYYKPLDAFGDFGGGVLLREVDVTGLVNERERREKMLNQMLRVLVAIVDRRDPFAAGHSLRVGRLARLLAEELVLPEKSIEAAETAGLLMNFGKVWVPRNILTKETALDTEELKLVRDNILASADIFAAIDFSVPVIPALRQVFEHVDGSGYPQGLKGEDILITARIISLANAFVAMASPRSYRPEPDLKTILSIVEHDADRLYDRTLVKVLVDYVKGHVNELDWLLVNKQY